MLGGLVFGLVGVMLPLTNFTGSDQLETALAEAGTLGIGLLLAILIGKMFTFAVSSATGFIGGPIFPLLFIGGTTGVLVNQIFPDVPLAPRVHLHAGGGARLDRRRAVLDGAADRAAHPGRRAADRTDPDRRRDLVPHDLRAEVHRRRTAEHPIEAAAEDPPS